MIPEAGEPDRGSVRALLEYPEVALPPEVAFDGCGVYTIHRRGKFPAYAHCCRDRPVYVGKADPAGKRQGRTPAEYPDTIAESGNPHSLNRAAPVSA